MPTSMSWLTPVGGTQIFLRWGCAAPGGGGGGGVLRFGSDGGVPLKPPNLYMAEKGTHY